MQRKFLSNMDRAFVEELRTNTRDKGRIYKIVQADFIGYG